MAVIGKQSLDKQQKVVPHPSINLYKQILFSSIFFLSLFLIFSAKDIEKPLQMPRELHQTASFCCNKAFILDLFGGRHLL